QKLMTLFVACLIMGLSVVPARKIAFEGPKLDAAPLGYPRTAFVVRFLIALTVMNVATGAFNQFANAYFSKFLRFPVEQIGGIFASGQFAQVLAILISP